MYRFGFCALALVVSVSAHAQDDDNDGVLDSIDNCVDLANPLQTDENLDGYGDDCVSTLATIAPNAVLGSGVSVQSRATVGAFASVGDGSTIAQNASLEPGSGASTGVVLGGGSIVSRGAVIESNVTTGTGATLGRASRLGTGTDVGTSLFLGYASTVGDDGLLADNIVIGNLVDIGTDADVANNVVFGRGGLFGNNVTAETGVVVGPEADIANNVTLRNGVKVRKNVTIGLGSELGTNVRIARNVTIGANVTISADARIGAGSDIGDFAVVDANTVLPRNTVIASSGGIVLQSGARRFQDGSVADRCETYVNSPMYNGALATSGIYTVDAGGSEYNVYCDMDTDGGGWTMCHSESGPGEIHVRTDEYLGTFGVDGYRARCRDIPFSEVLYTAHDRGQQAWFSRDTPGDLTASTSGFGSAGNGTSANSGTFTPHGITASSPAGGYNGDYQLLICDSQANETRLWMEVGFMVSGIYGTGYKVCNGWTSDVSTPYYRMNGDWNGTTYLGQAFNENGHSPAGDELMSVGLR